MPTILRVNGKPGHMELTPFANWLGGIIAALIVAGVCASIASFTETRATGVEIKALREIVDRDHEGDKFIQSYNEKKHDDLEARLRRLEYKLQ